MSRVLCIECKWCGPEAEMLTATSPFDPEDTVVGCPKCKTVNRLHRACDVEGCDRESSCGFPSDSGYRRTCGEHYRKMNSIEDLKRIAEQANPELRIERVGIQSVECPDGKTRVMIFAQGPLYEYKEVNAEVFKDTAHISAFNPETVLALIADWEKMRNTLKSTVGHEPFGKGDLNPYKISECLQSLQFKAKAGE